MDIKLKEKRREIYDYIDDKIGYVDNVNIIGLSNLIKEYAKMNSETFVFLTKGLKRKNIKLQYKNIHQTYKINKLEKRLKRFRAKYGIEDQNPNKK